MKSLYSLVVLAAVFFLLTACNHSDGSSKEDSGGSGQAEQTEQEPQQDNDQDEERNADKHNQNSSDGSDKQPSNHDNEKTNDNSAMTQKQVMAGIQDELDTDLQQVLPASLPLEKGQYLSAATKSDAGSYRVIFFSSGKPISINNRALNDKNQAKEIVRLQVKKWGSEQEANEQIGYENYKKNSGQQVDLGHDIKGYQDAGAGSMWTGWNEGRWAMATHARTTKPEAGEKLAKQAVDYLETHSLPIPQRNVMVRLDADGTNNQIIWQKKDVVYKIDQVDDPIKALDIATTFE